MSKHISFCDRPHCCRADHAECMGKVPKCLCPCQISRYHDSRQMDFALATMDIRYCAPARLAAFGYQRRCEKYSMQALLLQQLACSLPLAVILLPRPTGPATWTFTQCINQRTMFQISTPLCKRYMQLSEGTTGVQHSSKRPMLSSCKLWWPTHLLTVSSFGLQSATASAETPLDSTLSLSCTLQVSQMSAFHNLLACLLSRSLGLLLATATAAGGV